ncbi:MAG: FAD-dependent oxidoreductase [Dehalococcoidales bacterium]|nr:FAD-dependent oxidoreductase [Dehalococcoidales bacterium]
MVKEALFPRLFERGRIGTLELANRIVIPPMGTRLAAGSANHTPTPELIAHFRRMAEGGAGLVTVECVYDYPLPNKMTLCDDALIPQFKAVSDAIHKAGVKAAVQISTHRGTNDPTDPITPSEAPPTKYGIKPRVLTIEDIKALVERFAQLTRRIKLAGFDAISIHGAHGYLVSEFLSPLRNKRKDIYGGDTEKRARFAVELVQASRAQVGKDFPLIFRLMSDERTEGGLSIKDAVATARILEKAGIDAIDISSGVHIYSPFYMVSPGLVPHGYNLPLAEAVKKVVSVPVMVAGAINTPQMAEEALEKGMADFICIGRGAFTDPDFPKKWREGNLDDVRPCIRCLYCMERTQSDQTLRCSVNPIVGQQTEISVQPAKKAKKVAVIGGGPAGMEAAIIAAERGHQVTLFEKRKLGGTLIEASTPDFKVDLRDLMTNMAYQVKKAGVKVVRKQATSQAIQEGKFEAVIVANGATPCALRVPGIDKPLVVGALDVLNGAETGKNVVVIGGGLVGCDVSLFLAEKGKQVTIVEMLDKIAQGTYYSEQMIVTDNLNKRHVDVRTSTCLDAVTDRGVTVHNSHVTNQEIKADTVVLAVGFRPNKVLCEELQKLPVVEVCAIGDCTGPRRIHNAIHEGFMAACKI